MATTFEMPENVPARFSIDDVVYLDKLGLTITKAPFKEGWNEEWDRRNRRADLATAKYQELATETVRFILHSRQMDEAGTRDAFRTYFASWAGNH